MEGVLVLHLGLAVDVGVERGEGARDDAPQLGRVVLALHRNLRGVLRRLDLFRALRDGPLVLVAHALFLALAGILPPATAARSGHWRDRGGRVARGA